MSDELITLQLTRQEATAIDCSAAGTDNDEYHLERVKNRLLSLRFSRRDDAARACKTVNEETRQMQEEPGVSSRVIAERTTDTGIISEIILIGDEAYLVPVRELIGHEPTRRISRTEARERMFDWDYSAALVAEKTSGIV